MGFCSGTFKFFVFLFNFIFLLAGIAITALGGYMAIKMKDYFDFLGTSDLVGNQDLGVSSYIFIAVGVIVTIISFLGCCAACTDNKCMMGTFATLMALILIAELGVAITIFIYQGKAYAIVADAMNNGLKGYREPGKDGVTKGWDKIQEQFTCCGVNEPADWKNATKLGDNNAPDSCCKNEATGCGKGKLIAPYTDLHNKGCLKEFEEFIKSNVFLAGGVGLAVIAIQLIAVITGCCLAKKMGKDGDYV